MSSCTGNGQCIYQCYCTCFDDKACSVPSSVCTCGHRAHTKLPGGSTGLDIFCKSTCSYNCQLVNCLNYSTCSQKRPKWVLDLYNGMCNICVVRVGIVKFIELNKNCTTCSLNNTKAVGCGLHKICVNCWSRWTINSSPPPTTCIACNESMWKWKTR